MKTDGPKRFVAYYRVSTVGQGVSGLGLQAQQDSVRKYVLARGGELIGEFKEIESGRLKERPELKQALNECSRKKATLIIARLDRLARNLYVIVSLMESKVDFVAVDLPDASRLTIHIMAALGEHERYQISKNTKEALKAAKERGTVLGNPRLEDARPIALTSIKKNADDFALKSYAYIKSKGYEKFSLNKIATLLNYERLPTRRHGEWSAAGIKNIIFRVKKLSKNMEAKKRGKAR